MGAKPVRKTFLLAVFLSLLVMFGAIFFLVARSVWIRTASRNWPTVEGNVVESKVAVSCDPESCRDYPKVTYQYEVGGIGYVGAEGSLPGEPQAVVDQYPPGRPVTVYYNPNRPSQAVLVTGTNVIWASSWLFLAFLPLAVVTWIIIHAVRNTPAEVSQ